MSSLEDIRIVLIEPAHPGNIGGAARAMKTMGLSSLWLVRPQRFPDPQAHWRAAGADELLEQARSCESLEQAIGPCRLVIGTSTRARHIPWPALSARAAAAAMLDEPSGRPVALLFGRETSGLTNDELQRCHWHLWIPANPDYPSLNLAMAVQVVCYELYQGSLAAAPAGARAGARGRAAPAGRTQPPPASATEMEGFYAHLETVLRAVDFYDPESPRLAMARFRRLFNRVRPDETELRMLRGVLRQVQWRIGQSDDRTGGPAGPE